MYVINRALGVAIGLNIVLFLPFVPSKLLAAVPFIIPRLLGSTGRRSPIMLTSFIRRNGKKKGPKQPRVWPSSRSRRPPTSPESFESPEILDINEKSIYAPPEETYGPFVQLDLSTEPWFPEELLHARRISRASTGFLRNSGVAPSRPEQESVHDLPSSSGSPKPVVYLDGPAEGSPAKKSVPAPIFIPDPKLDGLEIQHERAKAKDKLPDLPQNDVALMDPSSPGSESISAVSGTTLARALIANSFILSSVDRVNSLPRSAISRQDSATLPRELPPLPLSSGAGDVLEQRRSRISFGIMGRRPPSSGLYENASPDYPSTDSHYLTSPEFVLHSGQPRHISPISEVPSAPNTPMSLGVTFDPQCHDGKSASIIGREIGTGVDSGGTDVPHTASDILSTPPSSSVSKPSWSATESSQTDPSSPADHSLDEYSFMPPGPQTALLSSCSDSSASFITPSPVKRSDSHLWRRPVKSGAGGAGWKGADARAKTPYQRNKKQIRLLPITQSFDPFTPAMMASSIPRASVSHLPLVPSSAVPAGHLEMPPTAREGIDQDYSELLDYTITVSPDLGSSSHYTSTSSSAGYQTFPETPMFSPPLFSPDYLQPRALTLRTQRPPLPRSATLPSPREHAAWGVLEPSTSIEMNSAQSQNEDVSSPRRPQSIASPNYTVSLPLSDSPHGSPHSIGSVPASLAGKVSSTISETNSRRPSTARSERETDMPMLEHSKQTSDSTPHSASSTSSIRSDITSAQLSTPLTSPPCTATSAASVPLPESTTTSPHLPSNNFSSSTSASSQSLSQTGSSSTLSHPKATRATTVASPLAFGTSFLPNLIPTPSPPLSPRVSPPREPLPPVPPLSQSHAPISRPSSIPSISASFVAPPPYHSVVSERQDSAKVPLNDANHPMLRTQSNPAQERDDESLFPITLSLHPSGRIRGRPRPPLPIGPRRPSGPAQPLGSFVPGFRERFPSESAVAGNDSLGNSLTWHKLYEAAAKPLPKFQTPRPKWRGLTMEAAQWTLTSSQLQNIVSRAIKQSAEGSSFRLLCLETLDGEIAEEAHRLEMLHTDVKSRYKALVRKRWQLLGALAGHLEDAATCGTASRTLEELAETTLAHDQLADELHCIAEQLAQLKSLRDVHHASALAMALRKVNAAFLHQMEEKQKLREQIETLEAERDEGWKQAEDVAIEYDRMMEASRGPSMKATNRRSAHVSAVRKSSVRRSKAGLRLSSSRRRSANSAGSRGSVSVPQSAFEDIPPVPPFPLPQPSTTTTTLTSGAGLMYHSGTSAARALAHAQQELYEILGLDFQDTPSSGVVPSRPRSASKPSDLMHASVGLRRLSDGEMTHSLRTRRAHENRAIHSVILDDQKAMLTALGLMSN